MQCDSNCSGCSVEGCGQRIEKYKLLDGVKIKKIIAVASGKGGVGKTMVTSLLAQSLNSQGYKVGILDSDITGPSIPRMFNLKGDVRGTKRGMVPLETENGIKIISTNFFLESEDNPVVWRGPILTNLIRQFYAETEWGELDYLLIDMPPGTGDVPLTIFQSVNVDGVIIVSTPQDLVSMVVGKAVKMCQMMNINIYGVVINMGYIKCPDCGKEIKLFYGDEEALKNKFNLEILENIPMDPKINETISKGKFSELKETFFKDLAKRIG